MSEEINVTSQEVTEENENEAVQIKLTRSEQREQVFMLLFSKSFTNTSVDNMVQDSSELFMGGVSALAQAEVEGIVSAKEELDEIISKDGLFQEFQSRRLQSLNLQCMKSSILTMFPQA